jgi:hypothetical protein
VDPVDDQVADLEDGLREELVDRRAVELRAFRSRGGSDGGGEQVRSLGKQRWLQLRGTGQGRGDDGRC